MTTRREQTYDRRLKELIEKAGKLEKREIERALNLLESVQKDIAAQVATTEWQAQHLPQLKAAIENSIESFSQQQLAAQQDALLNSWNLGIDMVDGPLSSAGIQFFAPEIARETLEILQGYSADLVGGLGKDFTKKVNNEITMGLLGGKTPFEVMQAIGTELEGKNVVGSIARRAETITRTEMGRVQSASRQARMNGVVNGVTEPDMRWKKKWIWSGKPKGRITHMALDGVVVDLDEDFAGGWPHPHAPGMPAAETINCG